MVIDIFKTILREFYEDPSIRSTPRDLKIALDSGFVISIIGCRRAGKTTILRQLIDALLRKGVEKERILFVNFEDERIPRRKDAFDALLVAHAELYPEVSSKDSYYFFDEVQEMPDWELFVRRLHETRSKNVFITGSNARFLSREIATALRGRTISYEVYPFSFKEFLVHKGIDPKKRDTTKEKALLRMSFEEYLAAGGFPETIQVNPNLKSRVFRSYLDVMIYRDLIERYDIKNTEVLKAFIMKRLSNVSKELSVNKTYNELKSNGFEVSKSSIYKFAEWCEEIFLLFSLPQYHESLVKQQGYVKKNYCVDNGLVTYTSFRASQDKGRLLENAVYIELKRRGKELFYHTNTKECDFVIVDKERVIEVIQVSLSMHVPDVRKRELEGLLQAKKRTGAENAFILTLEEEDEAEIKGEKVKILPAIKWFLDSGI
jgi:uncharacterized protein